MKNYNARVDFQEVSRDLCEDFEAYAVRALLEH